MNDEKTVASVPYVVFESAQARAERITRRLVIALILTIVLMFATNGLWLWSWMQYDYVSEDSTSITNTHTVDIDGKDGIASYIGGSGDIVNGTDSSDNNDDDKSKTAETEAEEKWEEQGNP